MWPFGKRKQTRAVAGEAQGTESSEEAADLAWDPEEVVSELRPEVDRRHPGEEKRKRC